MALQYEIEDYAGRVTRVSLAAGLRPEVWYDEGGVAERAKAEADLANKVMGELLARLVELKVISLSDANRISGNDVRAVKD